MVKISFVLGLKNSCFSSLLSTIAKNCGTKLKDVSIYVLTVTKDILSRLEDILRNVQFLTIYLVMSDFDILKVIMEKSPNLRTLRVLSFSRLPFGIFDCDKNLG